MLGLGDVDFLKNDLRMKILKLKMISILSKEKQKGTMPRKKCQQEGCTKSAISPTDFCKAHGGGHRCSGCGLVSVRSKGHKCFTCRSGSPRLLRLEKMVEDYLKKYDGLGNYSYRDEPLPCAPTRRRPDFTYVLPDRIVILEVDEDAHKFYNRQCECVRILELSEQARGLPIIVLRFNPKKRLLENLKKLLEEQFVSKIENIINVVFLGYKEEYDVVKTIMEMNNQH